MEYMGNSQWWNDRFKARELNIMKHEKILEEDIQCFPKRGKVLDLACGDGRNAIYLGRLGYEVTAIDFCSEALNRLSYFIEKESLQIKTKLLDFSKAEIFIGIERYDVIIINHYRLNPELYSYVMNCLKSCGVLWVNGFKDIPLDNPSISEFDVFGEDDFKALKSYKLVDEKIYKIGKSTFIRYMWRK